MAKELMKGNEALAEAAVRSGCTHFFGYPITPQNEIPEYLARELPKSGGVYLQAESELAAIHMVYGAASAGGSVMTSSSSPGIALMQEGISLLTSAELPCVIVNVQRAGPGIGGIQPAQADYFQMTRGGGNGGYRIPAYVPATIQESIEMMEYAFEVAEKYRTPVYVVSDGMLGQMMEPVSFGERKKKRFRKKLWTAVGHQNKRKPNIVKTMSLIPDVLEQHNIQLQGKYHEMISREQRYENIDVENAEVVLVAYGSTSRIVKEAIGMLAEEGIRAGLIRPRTIWPFPESAFACISDTCRAVISVEMSCGQMVEDVRLAVNGRLPVTFFGRAGGVVPAPSEITTFVKNTVAGVTT